MQRTTFMKKYVMTLSAVLMAFGLTFAVAADAQGQHEFEDWFYQPSAQDQADMIDAASMYPSYDRAIWSEAIQYKAIEDSIQAGSYIMTTDAVNCEGKQ